MSFIKDILIQPLTIAYHTPFVTSLGKKSVTRNVAIRVLLSSGRSGTGEASASLALPQETQESMTAWLKKVRPHFIRRSIEDFALTKKINLKYNHPTAMGALEAALLDAYANEKKRPLASFFGPNRKPIHTDVTLSAWDLPTTLKVAHHFYKRGFRRFKVKVGKDNWRNDLKRVHALNTQLWGATFWIDANQGYTVDDATAFMRVAKRLEWPIRAMEQPTPKHDIKSLAAVRALNLFPIFADESAGSINDVQRLIDIRAVDGIVVKIAKTGLREALRVVALARHHKLQTMISCMAESYEGLRTSVAWAVGDGQFDWVDLDTFLLFKRAPRHQALSASFVLSAPALNSD